MEKMMIRRPAARIEQRAGSLNSARIRRSFGLSALSFGQRLPGKGPFPYFKRHGLPHSFQKLDKLLPLMRRKKQLEQGRVRIKHRKHGQMLAAAFQKITKKTRITGSNTDQQHLRCAGRRKPHGLSPPCPLPGSGTGLGSLR